MKDTSVLEGQPRWEIDNDILSRAIDLVAAFPPGSPLLFSLQHFASEGANFLYLYATNRDYVYEEFIPILNKEDIAVTSTPFFIKFTVLQSLVKMYRDFAFVFDGGSLCFRNEYVSYQFKNSTVDTSTVASLSYAGLEWRPFPITKTALLSMKKMVEFGVKLIDNKVLWSGDSVKGSFITSAFDIRLSDSSLCPVQFRKFDISLMSLFVGNEPLSYVAYGDRFYLSRDGRSFFSFSLVSSPVQTGTDVIKTAPTGTVLFDLDQLTKAISFSRLDPASTVMVFTKDRNGNLYFKQDRASFFYVGKADMPVAGFALQIDSLRKIISVLPGADKEANCTIHKDGAVFFMTDADGLAYTFTIGKFDTLKLSQASGELIDKLQIKK
jgi:hypothetical protein